MASISKRKRKDGSEYWRVQIRKRGEKSLSRSFETEEKARAWLIDFTEDELSDANAMPTLSGLLNSKKKDLIVKGDNTLVKVREKLGLEVEVELYRSYGNEYFRPINHHAKTFCELLGRKNLVDHQLRLLKNAGWKIIICQPEYRLEDVYE